MQRSPEGVVCVYLAAEDSVPLRDTNICVFIAVMYTCVWVERESSLAASLQSRNNRIITMGLSVLVVGLNG